MKRSCEETEEEVELWKAGTHTWLWGGDDNLPARTIASRGFRAVEWRPHPILR